MQTYTMVGNTIHTHTTIPGPVFDYMTKDFPFAVKEELNRLNHGKSQLGRIKKVTLFTAVACVMLAIVFRNNLTMVITTLFVAFLYVCAACKAHIGHKKSMAIWNDISRKHDEFHREFFWFRMIDYPILRIDQIVGEVRKQLVVVAGRYVEEGSYMLDAILKHIDVQNLDDQTMKDLQAKYLVAKACLGDLIDKGKGPSYFIDHFTQNKYGIHLGVPMVTKITRN